MTRRNSLTKGQCYPGKVYTLVPGIERQDTKEILLGSIWLVDGVARAGWKSHMDAQS
jgi:hypothetical protein